jgi:uncharacterized protein YaaR (DUF327 family)
MAFKYKLAEVENKKTNTHAGTKDWDKKFLQQWDKEWDEKQSELSQDLQDKIKGIAKEALSKKKCYECKTIKK